MASIFHRLTDLSLRRVYKFVLKRALGRYLEDELLIDHLDVHSRDGIVRLQSIKLNAGLLNTELCADSPVLLKSVILRNVEVSISYQSLFYDGLKIIVGSLAVEVIPNPNANDKAGSKSLSPPPAEGVKREASSDEQQSTSTSFEASEEGTEGLQFIASWIEVIISKLNAEVREVIVDIYGEDFDITTIADKPKVRLELRTINFYNHDPYTDTLGLSSVDLSKSMLTEKSRVGQLGGAKLVEIGEIALSVHDVGAVEALTIVKLPAKVSIRVRTPTPTSPDTAASSNSNQYVDVNIDMPSLNLTVDKERVRVALVVLTNFASSSRNNSPHSHQQQQQQQQYMDATDLQQSIINLTSSKHKRTLQHLQRLQQDVTHSKQHTALSSDEHDHSSTVIHDSDLPRLLSLITKVYDGTMSSSESGDLDSIELKRHDSNAIESDGEFPSSDHDEYDEEEDEGMFKSALQGSVFDRRGSGHVRFGLLAPAPRSPSTSRQSSRQTSCGNATNSNSTISVRLFIGQASLQLEDCNSSACLNIIFDDVILALTSRNHQRHSHHHHSTVDLESKVNATFNGIVIYETRGDMKKKQMVSFVKSKDSTTIYSSPDVTFDLIYTTSKSLSSTSQVQPKVEITVQTTGLILSASIKQLESWVKCITHLVDLQVATEPTSTNIQITVSIPYIEVYLLSDDRISDSVWMDINQALLLNVCSHNWSLLKHQVGGGEGGLYFTFQQVHLSIKESSNDVKESDQYIGLTHAIMGMFIRLPGSEEEEGKVMKCKLISAYCNEKNVEDRVFIRRSNTVHNTANNTTSTSQKASFNPTPTTPTAQEEEGETMGPIAPKVDISHILFIRAYGLKMDIEEREFHALLMLTETLIVKEEKLELDFDEDEMTVEDITTRQTESKGGGEEEVTIGLHISTSYALINLSENSYELWEHINTTSNSQNTTYERLALFLQQAKKLAKMNEKTQNENSTENMKQNVKENEKKTEKEKLKICVSIRNPEVELYSVPHQIFVALKANDLSIYEMTPGQFRYLQSIQFDLHRGLHRGVDKAEDKGVRIGEEKFMIPFIRRAFVPLVTPNHSTSFSNSQQSKSSSNSKNNMNSSTLLADHSKYGNAFEIRLLLTHEDHLSDLHTIKSVHFFIDFYDILINHDPSSTWLFKLVRILTPQTAVQMIQNNLGSILDEIEIFQSFLSPPEQDEIRLLTSDHDLKGDFLATSMLKSQLSDTGNKTLVLSPFEITKISVRVRDSLVDFCHVDKQSRVILSVNLIAISSTIVSNSDRVTLKLSLTGLNFFAGRQHTNRKKNAPQQKLTNKGTSKTTEKSSHPKNLENPKNPNNLGSLGKSGEVVEGKSKLKVWMDDHNFVNLLEVDYLTNLVTMNQHELQDLSLSFTLGTCVIKGCYDSLVIFKDALAQWFVEFEASCAESETILRKKKKRTPPELLTDHTDEEEGGMIGEEGIVDRVRYYDEITFATMSQAEEQPKQEPKQVLIPESLLQSRIDLSARHLHSQRPPHPPPVAGSNTTGRGAAGAVAAMGDMNLMEDYYHQPSSSSSPMKKNPTTPVVQEESPRWEADYGYDNDSNTGSRLSQAYSPYVAHPAASSNRGTGGAGGAGAGAGAVYGQQYDYQSSIADSSTSHSHQHHSYHHNEHEEDDDLLFKSTLFEGQEEVTSELGDDEEEEILDDSDTLGNSSTAFPEEMQLYRSTSHHQKESQEMSSRFGLSNLFTTRNRQEKKEEDYEMKSMNHTEHSQDHPQQQGERQGGYDDTRGEVDLNDFEYYSREFEQQFRQLDPYHSSSPAKTNPPPHRATLRQDSGELVLSPMTEHLAPAPAPETSSSRRRQQPGLTVADLNDLEDLERAWEKVDTTNRLSHGSADDHASNAHQQHHQVHQQPEQQARWYFNPSTLDIRPHYIPLVTAMEHDTDHRPLAERQLMTKVYVQLNGHFKLRLYSGSQWPSTSTPTVESEEGGGGSEGDRTRSNSGDRKTVTFAPDTDTTTSSRGDRKKKSSLFQEAPSSSSSSSSLKKPSSSAIPAPSPSITTDTHKSKDKVFLPLEERQALDFFMKTVSLHVSIYDHGVSGNKLTVSVSGTGTEEGEWREFRESQSDLHSLPPQPAPQQQVPQIVPLAALPNQRITFSIQDFLLSFGSAKPGAQRKKVIGSWMNTQRPRDSSQPMVKFILLGYGNIPGQVEYRIHLTALPLRIFLSDEIVAFARGIVDDNHLIPPASANTTVSAEDTNPTEVSVSSSSDSDIYFQQVLITTLEVKIDYRASAISLKALQQGDYLQLLNIFPIDGLELSLKSLKFNGVNGSVALANKLLKAWVEDIYANQLHRVISGAAPLKSLSNIGKDLQGLLYIPANEFRGRNPSTGRNTSQSGQTGQVLKQLQRGTKSLLSTITRETLDVSHKLTMFMAQTITDLAADSQPQPLPPQQQQQAQVQRQPRGLGEGLTRGYSSVAREFSSAAETVIAVPVRQYERLGPSGLITSVVRALPIAVLRPIAGLAEGLSYTILGVRNRLDPDGQQDEEDLYNVDFQIP